MRILGLSDEGHDKALTPSEARTASQTFTHTFTESPPLSPSNYDRWTDTTSGITYTWYSNTWVELGPGGNFIDPVILPVVISSPVVTSVAFVGETATVTDGTWTESPYSFEYSWQVNASGWIDVLGEDQNSLVVPAAGEYRAAVRARNGAGWSDWAYSTEFNVVDAPTGMTFDGPTSTSAVLTNGGSTVSNDGSQDFATAWSSTIPSGKIYMEVILYRGASSDNFIIFAGDGVMSVNGTNPVIHWNTPRGGFALLSWSSFFRANYGMSPGAVAGNITAYGSATEEIRLKIAADITTRSFWAKEVGSAFAGDPVAGTSPIFTINGTGTIRIGAAAALGASVTIVNPSNHIDSPPAGFTAI